MRLKIVTAAPALLLISFPIHAETMNIPCASFRLQANGLLEVLETVTLSTSAGQAVTLRPGVRFGPGLMLGGLDVYELHRQKCR